MLYGLPGRLSAGAGFLYPLAPCRCADGTFAGYYVTGRHVRSCIGHLVSRFGRNGHLYVSDAELKALVEIDEGGHVVHRWLLPLQAVQPFRVPYASVDPRGHAYVSDFNGFALYHAWPDRPKAESIGASESLEWSSGVTTRDGEILVVRNGWNKILSVALP